MRTLRFVPLAYLAGVHGFALFAPYLALFLTASHFLRRRRPLVLVSTLVPASALEPESTLEPLLATSEIEAATSIYNLELSLAT